MLLKKDGNMKTFAYTVSDEEYAKALAFLENGPPEPSTAIGGGTTYKFTPTSIGIAFGVRRWDGESLDCTDYDSW